MPVAFSSKELIDIAIGIERRGIIFYDIMAKSTDNAAANEVFDYLANMERQHIQIFQGHFVALFSIDFLIIEREGNIFSCTFKRYQVECLENETEKSIS